MAITIDADELRTMLDNRRDGLMAGLNQAPNSRTREQIKLKLNEHKHIAAIVDKCVRDALARQKRAEEAEDAAD